jgi:hypothetical protein
MQTCSAATRASNKTAETVIIAKGVPEVKSKAEAKVAIANIAVDSVMVRVATSVVEPSTVEDTEKEKANAKHIGTKTINSIMPFQVIPITTIDSHAIDAEDATITTANFKAVSSDKKMFCKFPFTSNNGGG